MSVDMTTLMLSKRFAKRAASEGYVDPDLITNNITEYLNEHPIVPGASAEEVAQLNTNTNDIATLKADVSFLQENSMENTNFKGMKMSLLGDSISAYRGYISAANSAHYGFTLADGTPRDGVSSVDEMWWKIVCDELGMIPHEINAWSGSSVSTGVNEEYDKFAECVRCEHLGESPDVIFIAAGGNDYLKNVPIGTWNGHSPLQTDTTNFRSAYANMLDKIRRKYPDAAIICITPWYLAYGLDNKTVYYNKNKNIIADFGDAVKDIAKVFDVNVIDSFMFGFNRYNYAKFNGGDGVHPNALGQYVIGHSIAAQTKTLLNGWFKYRHNS